MGTHIEDIFLAERAAEWLHRLPTATPQQRAEFFRWLKESPKHVREMLLAMSWDELLRSVDPGRKIDVDKLAGDAAGDVVRLQSGQLDDSQPGGLLHRDNDQHQTRRENALTEWLRPWSWAAVAAFAVAMVAILLAVVLKGGWSNPIVSTESGEWKTQTLSDGTTVQLGPLTEISVRLSDGQRLVRLSNGDALFDVFKDAQRPFVVETDRASVRAVGTMFGVTRAPDRTVVTVSEGTVAVSDLRRADELGEDATVMVSAGEQVVIDDRADAHQPIAPVKRVNVKNELAWVEGYLVFSGTPAGVAVEEFNRRNDRKIALPSPGLAGIRIYGRFRIGDPEGFVRVVGEMPRG